MTGRQAGTAVRDKLLFLFGGIKQVDRGELTRELDDGQFRYQVLEGVGHGINHERPEEVNRLMCRFLLGEGDSGETV